MNDKSLFLPIIAMVAITLLAWLRLYQLRFAEMARRKIDPQSIALSAQKDAGLTDTRGADNFNNQFQLPVLFYVVCLCLYVTEGNSMVALVLAWIFVAARYIHAAVHMTTNRMPYRQSAFAVGYVVLGLLWVWFALHLLAIV